MSADPPPDDRAVAVVRRFNRTVTDRIGALDDHYQARGRSLGACRLLWEIEGGGTDIRSLRNRLDLDSGYLSRLLRSLEADGLISTVESPADRRVRTIRLTRAGRTERAALDRIGDDVARSLLEPLTPTEQDRLVEAARTVERLLTAGLLAIEIEDPRSDDAAHCIGAYFAELDHRFEDGFDPGRSISADVEELTEPAGLLLVARVRSRPIGCGALKFHPDDSMAEIKRMWVDESSRGLGLGRRLLTALEAQAVARGLTTLRLETNRTLPEAIALYRSAGYREVDAFNDEFFAHHWFEKRLELGRPPV